MLIVRPAPFEGESLPGYLLRLATANGLPGLAPIAKLACIPVPAIGLGALGQTCLSSEALAKLNQLTGVSPSKLAALSTGLKVQWKRVSSASWQDKLELPLTAFRTTHAAVCPSCLRQAPYLHINWQCSLAVYCVKHRTLLVDKCPKCTQPISWSRHHHLICGCGQKLSDIRTVEVSESMRLDMEPLLAKLLADQQHTLLIASLLAVWLNPLRHALSLRALSMVPVAELVSRIRTLAQLLKGSDEEIVAFLDANVFAIRLAAYPDFGKRFAVLPLLAGFRQASSETSKQLGRLANVYLAKPCLPTISNQHSHAATYNSLPVFAAAKLMNVSNAEAGALIKICHLEKDSSGKVLIHEILSICPSVGRKFKPIDRGEPRPPTPVPNTPSERQGTEAPSQDGMLSIPDVARHLSVHPGIAYNLCQRHVLPSTVIKGIRYASRETVEAFRREYMFTSEIAQAYEVASNQISDRLKDAGLQPRHGPKVDGVFVYVFSRSDVARIDLQAALSKKNYQTSSGRPRRGVDPSTAQGRGLLSLSDVASRLAISRQKASRLMLSGFLVPVSLSPLERGHWFCPDDVAAYEAKYRYNRQLIAKHEIQDQFGFDKQFVSYTLNRALQLRPVSDGLIDYYSRSALEQLTISLAEKVTVSQAATMLATDRYTVLNLRKMGLLTPSLELGQGTSKVCYFERKDVARLAEEIAAG